MLMLCMCCYIFAPHNFAIHDELELARAHKRKSLELAPTITHKKGLLLFNLAACTHTRKTHELTGIVVAERTYITYMWCTGRHSSYGC